MYYTKVFDGAEFAGTMSLMARHKEREAYDPILSMRVPEELKQALRKEAKANGMTLTCYILGLIQAGRRHHARYGLLPREAIRHNDDK